MTKEQFDLLDDRLANLEELVGHLRHIDLKTSEEVSRQDLMVAVIEGVRLGITAWHPSQGSLMSHRVSMTLLGEVFKMPSGR
jgi:hypothetical protein